MFPIFIDLVVTFSSDAEVPKIMNSVLLSLSFNMLVCIQLRSASMQRSKRERTSNSSISGVNGQ